MRHAYLDIAPLTDDWFLGMSIISEHVRRLILRKSVKF